MEDKQINGYLLRKLNRISALEISISRNGKSRELGIAAVVVCSLVVSPRGDNSLVPLRNGIPTETDHWLDPEKAFRRIRQSCGDVEGQRINSY